ncbi:MAG: Protein kinase, partial [bacterium]|nr:Protein kinase [bacterium]
MSGAPRCGGVFGRYLLIEQLGQGGMAQIWRARLARSEPGGHEVVVKTLHPRLLGQPLFTELFAAEARVTKLMSHPGVVRIVDHGAVKRWPFLAMERIDGCDLSMLFRALPSGRRVPIQAVVSIAIELCRAVGYAHDWRDEDGLHRPIVHGDLSPSNVMIRCDGGVTLIDFGVAHMDARIARGQAQLVIGKSGYLAPELFEDAVPDARTDVFSAGVVLHELLAGRHLFVVESERETLRRLAETTVPPLSSANPNVPRKLDEIVLRALCRDPAQRFRSASEMAEALERLKAPGRATRGQVAAFVRPLLDGGVPLFDEPVTTSPIAPAASSSPAAVLAARVPAAVRQSTATINQR